MIVSETERLKIRHFIESDTDFIIKLLNQPSFIENIADKCVRNKSDAIDYLNNGPLASYQQYGFGLSMVELKGSNMPIGMCGLIKREELDDVDIGYALLTEFEGKGYAKEAAQAVLENASAEHGLKRIIAVTKPSNLGSIKLLESLGFEFEEMVELYGINNKLFGYEFLFLRSKQSSHKNSRQSQERNKPNHIGYCG